MFTYMKITVSFLMLLSCYYLLYKYDTLTVLSILFLLGGSFALREEIPELEKYWKNEEY